MDFEEWWDMNGELYRRPTSDERYLFESGQQTKQAEIDALQNKIDKIREVVEERYGDIDYWADVAFDYVIEELDK